MKRTRAKAKPLKRPAFRRLLRARPLRDHWGVRRPRVRPAWAGGAARLRPAVRGRGAAGVRPGGVLGARGRFSREGIRKTIHYLQQLDGWSVRFTSYTEPYLDTSNELVAHILLGVLSYFAELEAKKISERTKAGLARARAEGKTLGRSTKLNEYRGVLGEMRRRGYSQGRMARETGLAYNTVKRYLRQLEEEGT